MDAPLIKIEQLSVKTGNGDHLDGLSLEIGRGDSVVLFGPERSGLGVLVPVLLGLNNEYEGAVYYRGRLVKEFDYVDLHIHMHEIGYLHGDYGLMSNMSVEENLALPLEYHSGLTGAEIGGLVDSTIAEFGLELCRTSRPISLTGSEIFRAAYGRAVINDPDLLIIEHAVVDHSLINIRASIANIMRRKADARKTTLFFTHQPKIFLDFAAKFIMLYDGAVVYQGDSSGFEGSDNPYLRQYLAASQDGPMTII